MTDNSTQKNIREYSGAGARRPAIKCIALDLDRTTLNAQGRLSSGNRRAIEYAVGKGVHIVVASGRALHSLPAEVLDIKGIEYAVTSNGAAIYHLEDKKCLRQYKLTKESVGRILELTEEELRNGETAYEVFIEGEAYAQSEYVKDPVHYGASPKAVGYIQGSRRPVDDITGFIREHISELESMDIVNREGEGKERIWKRLKENVPDIYMTTSVAQLIEISYKDAGKHMGLAFLINYLGLDRKETAAFGDGDNDAQMLAFAGVGIAVGNASIKCREAADFITGVHDEDGVAEGIYKLLG